MTILKVIKFREQTPARKTNIISGKPYHSYRKDLEQDFNHRCGYCNDLDMPRSSSFEIDHFVPKKLDNTKINDYSNLVYSCHSCNNAKRAKWPTCLAHIPNNGKEGWIDPCDVTYGEQFARDSTDGSIIPLTDLGKWMYDNLKLWKTQHSFIWRYEQLEKNLNLINNAFHNKPIPNSIRQQMLELLFEQKKLLNMICNNYEQ